MLKLNRPLIFFDLETTGINVQSDLIVEIAMMKIMPDGGESTNLRHLVNPQVHIPKDATAVHHITDEMVKDAPVFGMIAPEILAFMEGCDLAGFNSNIFDIPLLYNEFVRHGYNWNYQHVKFVDVGNLYKKMEPRTLSAAHRFYCGTDFDDAHTAMADVTATMNVFQEMLNRYKTDIPADIDELAKLTNFGRRVLDLSGKFTYNAEEQIIFNFGKFKGELASKHKDYLDWIIRSDFQPDTKAMAEDILSTQKKQGV